MKSYLIAKTLLILGIMLLLVTLLIMACKDREPDYLLLSRTSSTVKNKGVSEGVRLLDRNTGKEISIFWEVKENE